MALRWRYESWQLRIYYKGEEFSAATGLTTKQQALRVETAIRRALKTREFHLLSDLELKLCGQILRQAGEDPPWAQEPEGRAAPMQVVQEEGAPLTLWKGVEIMIKSPALNGNPNRERHEQILAYHIVPYFRPDCLIDSMWTPQIEAFLQDRKEKGFAGSTINKCRATLSVLFRELIKHRLIKESPVTSVAVYSEADGEREIYISKNDFETIVERCPEWVQPILRCLYMTGMRANEALILTPSHLDLKARIIKLRTDETKERRPKRVPIHRDLLPVLKELAKGKSPDQPIFVSGRRDNARIDSVRKPWKLAIDKAISDCNLSPELRRVTVKDIRHVFATNMERSHVRESSQDAILGHALKKKTVKSRYRAVSDQDLRKAIDMTTFDHGETEIYVARKKKIPAAATTGNNIT